MTLDRSTYEAWLLDRIEGNLTPEQERALDAFLAANPDLPSAADTLPYVTDDRAVFAEKGRLKRTYPPIGTPDRARLDDFLAARLEGDLTSQQEQQLDRFLYEHPELAQEAARMAAARVARTAEHFPEKAELQRHFPPTGLPDAHRLTDFLIAAQEGDLTVEQRTALEAWLHIHPEAQREQRLVVAARIQATTIVHPDKEALKKREPRVIALWPRLAAAASVVLLVGLAWWLLRERNDTGTAVARTEHPLPPTPVIDRTPHDEPTGPSSAKKDVPSTSSRDRVNADVQQEEHPRSVASAPEQPVRQEQFVPTPMPARMPEPDAPAEPSLAQIPEQVPTPAHADERPPTIAAPAATNADGSGQDLATLVANTVRGGVLDEPKRRTALDGNDALAAVDKGLNALTGGGVQVQRTGVREHVHLRLGRNLSISASRGR